MGCEQCYLTMDMYVLQMRRVFNQDLSNWCVSKYLLQSQIILVKVHPLTNNNKPKSWGTCSSPFTNTWKGTTDNNWGTASNWSTSSVPTATQNVTIPSGLTNYPTATSAVSFNTMTLKNGATFIPESTVNGSNNITYTKSVCLIQIGI